MHNLWGYKYLNVGSSVDSSDLQLRTLNDKKLRDNDSAYDVPSMAVYVRLLSASPVTSLVVAKVSCSTTLQPSTYYFKTYSKSKLPNGPGDTSSKVTTISKYYIMF